MRILLLLLTVFTTLLLSAQEQERLVRKLPAVRTTQMIVIDGDLNDSAWLLAPLVTDFIEWRPTYGLKEEEKNRTEVKILYDDKAIYVSGYMYETSADSITKELVGRDVVGVNDFVGVIFDTYNDKINGFGYFVTALGEQFDAKYSSTGEDGSWNSVYETQTRIYNNGWSFEMRIPYAAIRFGNKNLQDWGINITRRRSKSGKQLTWNPINPLIGGGFLAQFGQWTGVQNIKPPIRLSFSPYLTTYANHYPYNSPGVKNLQSAVNGGMDLKYGINQAFTLDMTLVPDFGQVQSDNQVLNLTPFEVRFNENRTFFTEGTELFSKGNLFYSRRIGGTPLHLDKVQAQLQPGESISRNPTETRLLNASKISGRSQSGLGIGFFNAITKAQYATIEKNGKEERKIETNPLTNYNIIVLDQSLKNNSSISLINTNVTRSGNDYDANVTAALWDVYDKRNRWNLFGKVATSQLIGKDRGKTISGYSHNMGFGKSSGRFNFEVFQQLANHTYDHNDMGYFTNNNYMDHGFWLTYRWIQPKQWYNRINVDLEANHSMRYKPMDYQRLSLYANINAQLKNLWWAGLNANFNAAQHDFYEPRVQGKIFKRPASWFTAIWFETNTAKKYSAVVELVNRSFLKYGSNMKEIIVKNNYRFNQKLTISTNSNLQLYHNNLGFATMFNTDSIVFALRNRTTVENIFNIKYNFTNKMGLTFRARHYWSRVINKEFFSLQPSGDLRAIPGGISNNVDNNVNYFNIDMVYTWQFALGSFINVVWKNAISTFDTNTQHTYFKNLGNTLEADQQNSLSIRVIYFLDYLSLKKRK